MLVKRILLFTISLLFITSWVEAQETEEEEPTYQKKEKEDFSHDRDKFLRIGVDPIRYFQSYLQPGTRNGLEVQVDYELNMKVIPAFEIGWHSFNRNTSTFDFSSYGTYYRLGIDYNFVQFKKASDKDMFFMGLRLASGNYFQKAENIKVENFYETSTYNIAAEANTAYWGEFTIGVKTEIAKNWFVGWTARGKLLFSNKGGSMDPYLIPGFGKKSELNKTASDINFYIAYAIPIKRAK